MSTWEIQRLNATHDRSDFDCGVPVLNDWLQKLATQHDRRDLARIYVLVRTGESKVLGYYALLNHHVRYEALPPEQAKGLPRIDVPVILLGRLAIDRSVQGDGLGRDLLIDALRRVQFVAEQVGIRAVEVDAIDDSARQFYLKFGFTQLLDDARHLLLPMKVVRNLKLQPWSG